MLCWISLVNSTNQLVFGLYNELFTPCGQIYFQDLSSLKPELKLPSSPLSPIIDAHLSPDGTMIAYVRDFELHVLNLLFNEVRQLTFGAKGNTLVSFTF